VIVGNLTTPRDLLLITTSISDWCLLFDIIISWGSVATHDIRPAESFSYDYLKITAEYLSDFSVCLFWNSLCTVHPSALKHCWLSFRKSIWPVKNLSDMVLSWLYVWSKVQMICIWFCWCHCHPIISCFIKIDYDLPFWCRLNQVVLEKRPSNRSRSSSSRPSSSSSRVLVCIVKKAVRCQC